MYFPSENEDFLAGGFLDDVILDGDDVSEAKDPSSEMVVPASVDRCSDVGRVTNSPVSTLISVDQRSGASRVLNSSSSESGNVKEIGDQGRDVSRSNYPSHDFRIHEVVTSDNSSNSVRVLHSSSPEYSNSAPASSQGSGNCGSGSTNSLSLESGNCDRDVSSKDTVQEIKFEEMGKNCLTKRKKEHEEANIESRSSKFRRSAMPVDSGLDVGNDEEEKRKARLMRNRESAQLSRQRKKHYVEELEDKVRAMHSTITDLNSKISFMMAENASLRQQLSGGGGMCPQPPPGMYPPHPSMAPPMAYPWMHCAPYVVKPQGSQVPLVPIPRLKTQQPVSAPKPKKESKKTKKVASISLLGLLFFMLLFGGLVPIVNVQYGGIGEKVPGGSVYVRNRFNDKYHGRVLTVSGHLNGSDDTLGGLYKFANNKDCERGRVGGKESKVEPKEQRSRPLPDSDGFDPFNNSSEPLVASLYVPRNDKLVKIDGNLIIHSIMASEKAMASRTSPETKSTSPETKNNEETGLALASSLAPALAYSEAGRTKGRHSHLYRNPGERQRALSGSADSYKDNIKSPTADGKLQQWFREGLAGPMLGSGMCTEVFQFDVSPSSAPGAIIPAPSVFNRSSENNQNSTQMNMGRNRRILHGLPIPLNITEEGPGRNSTKDEFQGNKSLSSMIVSVLVDPREAGDGGDGGDGMIGPKSKSLSRIFVVVLLDSVKYVTYSCVLPIMGSTPHLVTT